VADNGQSASPSRDHKILLRGPGLFPGLFPGYLVAATEPAAAGDLREQPVQPRPVVLSA
jgi:hypothetical protein